MNFYKPNSYNTGSAVSFNYNEDDGGVYVSIIKQHSWNAASKTGSFKENRNNPAANKSIKLNDNEISGMIRSIEERTKWSSFHKYNNGSGTSISFGPYEKEGILVGFGLSVIDTKNKENKFGVSFTLDELVKVREYFKYVLFKTFDNDKFQKANQSKPAQASPDTVIDDF
jgi:hypothetical protein